MSFKKICLERIKRHLDQAEDAIKTARRFLNELKIEMRKEGEKDE